MKKVKKQAVEAVKEEEMLNDIKRIQADFINYRNKVEGEKEAYANYKLEQFILEILDVIDNFELSLKNSKDKGVEMIHKQFLDILSKNNVEKIENKEDFDPEIHEAVEKVDGKEGKVVEIVKNGYKMNDKIIRPIQVRVGGGK